MRELKPNIIIALVLLAALCGVAMAMGYIEMAAAMGGAIAGFVGRDTLEG